MKVDDVDTLVTGATGFLGRWLLASLTARGRSVAAVVRDAASREGELRAFVASLGGDPSRLWVVSGDVEAPGLGLTHGLTAVRDVYHLAARFAFGLSAEQARRTNVQGTQHAIDWARGRPALRRFVFLGGYRMTRPSPDLRGLRSPLSSAQARRLYATHGAYEASKHEAWWLFQRLMAEHPLPWTAVHPSGVIGDSRTGRCTQVVGLGETVEKLWRGKLPALAGSPRTFVPVVAVDYLADFLATVPERPQTLGQQLTVLDPRTPELPALVRQLAAHLGVRAPSLVLPLGLVRALPSRLTGLDREAMGFLSEDRYDTRPAEEHAQAMGLTMPPLDATLARWCAYLIAQLARPSATSAALPGGAA